MNEIMEKIKDLVNMYKKEQINDYVLGRELANYMGDRSHVIISKDNKNIVTKTFAVFIFPQLLSDGFHITYIIDAHAIKEFYNSEEFAVVMSRLKDKNQKYIAKFNRFNNDTKNNIVTYGQALGFFLDLYSDYMSELRISSESDKYLPEIDEIKKYADKFNTETNDRSDIESLTLKGYVCDEVIDFVKKYVHDGQKIESGLTIKVIDSSDFDMPQFNLGQQELLKLATSSFGTRDHKEIPHDYQPPR